MEHLTINQVAKELNCHPNTVRQHLADWGFFKMVGSEVWRIKREDLERAKKRAGIDPIRKRSDNDRGLSLSVEENKKCRSTDEKQTVRGGLISQPQTARELREALERL